MNISEELNEVIKDAYLYAQKIKSEYVTPETVLLVLCDNEDFICAVEECGAGQTFPEILEALADSAEMYTVADGFSNKLFVAYAPYTA